MRLICDRLHKLSITFIPD